MTFKYNVVADLQNYMFSVLAKEEREKEKEKEKEKEEPLKEKEVVLNPFFSPRTPDSLFWCFYVMKNGIVAYEKESSTFVKEKEEKIKYVLLLRNNKELLKKHKITKLIDIENNLSLEKTINLVTFFALCALENMNAVVLQPKTQIYSDIIVNAEGNMFVLHQDKHKFKLVLDQSPVGELTYEKTHFKLPLKSISAYKLADLHSICVKLSIIVPVECKKKQAIYSLITDALNNAG